MMNYFELFNLPIVFELDQTALTTTWQTLQQLTHPDKFATARDAEKLAMVQKNAQVNDAYQVLKSPMRRAEHMLELRGVELQHEQKTMQDMAFLMQQMEWREQLEDIPVNEVGLDQLEDMDDEVQAQIKQHLQTLKSLLEQHSDEANQKSADEIRKLKFMYKLREEIASKEDAINDL